MTNELTRAILHYKATLSAVLTLHVPLCSHHCLVLSAGKKHPVPATVLETAHKMRCTNWCAPWLKPTRQLPPRFLMHQRQRRLRVGTVCQAGTSRIATHNGLTILEAARHYAGRGAAAPACVVHIHGCQRLVLPYLAGTFSEHIFQLRYRALDPSDDLPKWTCEKIQLGVRRLFNLPLLAGWSPNDVQPLVITESELDCLMLLSIALPRAAWTRLSQTLPSRFSCTTNGQIFGAGF